MSDGQVNVRRFDEWLGDDSDVAALVMRQWLEPVEGRDAVIFPPTYPIGENKPGYNIDREGGPSVCQIDSVGSQANRMEPIFKREGYKHLVPQVIIKAGKRDVHLLDAGHRAADAIARFSTIGPRLHEAFRAYQEKGNAEPLAKIAPTSIVFGSWDSRATQAKLPRVVRSVVRAYNVRELRRSAQYSTIAGEILQSGDAEVTTKGPKAELGLAHVPAVFTPGGVQVLGEIRRDATLNLSALRALAAGDNRTLQLRRYILGLALVSFTAPAETFLREGCHLVPANEPPPAVKDRFLERKFVNPEWKLVKHDGARQDFRITHDEAIAFATAAAKDFGVEDKPVHGSFDSEIANKVLGLSEEDRKNLLKQGPVTRDAIEQLKQKGAKKGKAQKP